MKPIIRYMEVKDVQTVVHYDRKILGQSLGTETFLSELRSNPFTFYFIVENPENMSFIGHFGLWIDEPLAQVLNIYVIDDYQGRGYGTLMMDYLLDYLKKRSITTLTLEVRESNERGLRFYQKFGFYQVSIRKNYYENGENAKLLLKNIE